MKSCREENACFSKDKYPNTTQLRIMTFKNAKIIQYKD